VKGREHEVFPGHYLLIYGLVSGLRPSVSSSILFSTREEAIHVRSALRKYLSDRRLWSRDWRLLHIRCLSRHPSLQELWWGRLKLQNANQRCLIWLTRPIVQGDDARRYLEIESNVRESRRKQQLFFVRIMEVGVVKNDMELCEGARGSSPVDIPVRLARQSFRPCKAKCLAPHIASQ
jgi:hypothetical protein